MEKTAPASYRAAEGATTWARALARVHRELPESSFKMWFAALEARVHTDGVLEIVAPSEYVKSWLAHHYLDVIRKAIRESGGAELAIRLSARERAEPGEGHPSDGPPAAGTPPLPPGEVPAAPPAAPPGPPGLADPAARGSPAAALEAPEIVSPLGAPPPAQPPAPAGHRAGPRGVPDAGTPFPERYTFETFVLGPSNRFAHAAAMAVAEAAPSRAYNPLFIYGGVGLGKTHLLYAIAKHMAALTPRLRIKYVTSETFITEFIRAIREGQGYSFQRRYRDVDVLLVDDIQFLAGKEETQTEFFHTFNDLHRAERQIVIASDRPPQELSGLEDRLRNRFRWGLCVDIQPPDLETRIAILQMKGMRDGLEVPDDVVHFIAEKFDSNIRELEGALLRVAAFASLSRLSIDLALAERALEDLLPQGSQEISSETILSETARYFGLRREDLVSKSRSRPLTTARHIAMYLLRELTGLSLIKIGELFDRDHSTALHGIQKIEGQMPVRGSTYRQVQELTKTIKAAARAGR